MGLFKKDKVYYKDEVNNYFEEKGFKFEVNSYIITDIFKECLFDDEIKKLELLIEFALKNEIKLKINKKADNGRYALLWACIENNIEMVNLIIEYANRNDIILELWLFL